MGTVQSTESSFAGSLLTRHPSEYAVVGFVESGAVDLTGDARVVFEGRLGPESTRGFS